MDELAPVELVEPLPGVGAEVVDVGDAGVPEGVALAVEAVEPDVGLEGGDVEVVELAGEVEGGGLDGGGVEVVEPGGAAPGRGAPALGTVGSAAGAGTVMAGSTTQVMGWPDNVLSKVSIREPGPIARAHALSRAAPLGPNRAESAGSVSGTSQVTGSGMFGVLPTKEMVVRQLPFGAVPRPSSRLSSSGRFAVRYPLGNADAGMVSANGCLPPAARGARLVAVRVTV